MPSNGRRIGEPVPGRQALNPCALEFRTESSVAAGADAIRALANIYAKACRRTKQAGQGAIAN
jgi:hypothetical protein